MISVAVKNRTRARACPAMDIKMCRFQITISTDNDNAREIVWFRNKWAVFKDRCKTNRYSIWFDLCTVQMTFESFYRSSLHLVDTRPFLTREITFLTICWLTANQVPTERESTLKGRNLLPRVYLKGMNLLPKGANSFLLEKIPF